MSQPRNRLARSVRAEEPGHRAGADVEAEVVHGGGGAVALDQAACLDHVNPPMVSLSRADERARPPWRARSSACAVHATDRAAGREHSQHPSWWWGFPPEAGRSIVFGSGEHTA